MNSFEEKLLNYAKASYPVLYINTHEEARVTEDIKSIWSKRKEVGKIYYWDCLTGLVCTDPTEKPLDLDSEECLAFIGNGERSSKTPRSVYILKDFHLELESKAKYRELVRKLKFAMPILKRDSSMVIFISHNFIVPPEWSKEIQSIDFDLPDEEAIKKKLKFIHESLKKTNKVEELNEDFIEKSVNVAKGMTASEIETSFALATVVSKGKFSEDFVQTVFEEKIQTVKKNSLLTYIPSDISFSQVGGLKGIKKWVQLRKRCFTKDAIAYGLPSPKGLMMCGLSGCGKTHLSKAIAHELCLPLWGFDIGSLFGSLVGATEQRVREVIKTIESMGPSVILIDEIEKSLNVNATSGSGDSGTSSRMFATLLSWMSDRTSPAFIVATSNNHTILPVELTRPGRFDNLFWIDLPTQKDRFDILSVVIKKFKRDPKQFNIENLAKQATDFTGSEIEEVFKSAMFNAFSKEEEIADTHIMNEILKFVPQAKKYPDKLASMRAAAKDKLQSASDDGETINIDETVYRSLELN